MIDVNMAREAAVDYCRKNNLSLDKLELQFTSVINGCLYFWQENTAVSDGLKNDMDTMPYNTLIVKNDYSVHETSNTTKYLI